MSEIKQISLNGTVYDLRDADWIGTKTNCITKIPQDIKLELNNGTLTLKAGSKVYVPNGSGNFDTLTIDSDKTNADTTKNGKHFLCVNQSGTLTWGPVANSTSGAGATPQANMAFAYDTTANTIKRYGDATTLYSFPIAICTLVAGTGITSIDQVFNGLGYVGSTVFALPGVKGLVPIGRNTDGTLKNTTASLTSVQTTAFTNQTQTTAIRIGNNYLATGIFPYDEKTNYNYNATIAPGNERTQVNAGSVTVSSGTITSFNPKTVFHALDYNDSEYIANCAMPSNRYIDLSSTTITDGMTLTAPADGYYSLYKASSAAGQMIGLLNAVSGLAIRSYASNTGETLGVIIPVSKGQTITVRNNAGGNTTYFRFIYANGSK